MHMHIYIFSHILPLFVLLLSTLMCCQLFFCPIIFQFTPPPPGGNSKTLMFVNMSPSSTDHQVHGMVVLLIEHAAGLIRTGSNPRVFLIRMGSYPRVFLIRMGSYPRVFLMYHCFFLFQNLRPLTPPPPGIPVLSELCTKSEGCWNDGAQKEHGGGGGASLRFEKRLCLDKSSKTIDSFSRYFRTEVCLFGNNSAFPQSVILHRLLGTPSDISGIKWNCLTTTQNHQTQSGGRGVQFVLLLYVVCSTASLYSLLRTP